jgi:hypothetical protein
MENPYKKSGDVYNYPSHFGSHSSMIDEEETKKLDDSNLVVLKDEHGIYTTERRRLDDGCTDPNRCISARLKIF